MDELLRLLDDARAEERREAREREHRLRHLSEEGASLTGTLVDLAERGSEVAVRTTAGRSLQGIVRLVGADFVVLGGATGDVWLALRAVATVRPDPSERHTPASGDRRSVDLLLMEALARIAPDRPRLALVTQGGEVVAGELRAVGTDVVTLRSDGDGGLCYVSASAIGAVLRSG